VWREDCDPGPALRAGGRAEGAFRMNGMTEERLARARPAEEVARTLRTRLDALAREHAAVLDLRAYNVAFDRPFLEAPPWGLAGPWGPCVMLEAQRRLGYRPKLAGACGALGVAWPEGPAHDAGTDALAALLLHEAMQALAPVATR
jgi:DNA polymerase III epsilon subunit-like protein